MNDFPDEEEIIHFAAIGQKLRAERTRASLTVEPLLRDTPRSEWPALAEHEALQNIGAIDQLTDLVKASLSSQPHYALALAELAVSLAEGLPDHAYPRITTLQTRAGAWKYLAKALRTLNRNPEAIEACHRAEAYVSIPALGHDLADIRFNLAVSYQELGRFDESLAILNECKALYRTYSDTERLVMTGVAEGILLQRLKRFREARESYLLLLATTPDIDTTHLAALHHAIGFCSIELGELTEADANLALAAKYHREAGQTIELLKAEAGRGRLCIRRGDIEEGILHLRPIRRQFLFHGMPEEAGICGLEIVEGLLVRGNAAQAETMARMILREFTNAGLSTRAITALGYLTEAIAAREAPPKLAGTVRQYIISLRTEPERDFRPRG